MTPVGDDMKSVGNDTTPAGDDMKSVGDDRWSSRHDTRISPCTGHH